jgi:signal transduction histidine kinase
MIARRSSPGFGRAANERTGQADKADLCGRADGDFVLACAGSDHLASRLSTAFSPDFTLTCVGVRLALLGGTVLKTLKLPQGLFKYQSGRVIALGRVMLATMYLLALALGRSEPERVTAATYALLFLYVAAAVGIAAATWRNWWLDARLAIPMHGVDMAVFTAIVFSTNGSTSPFFLFFLLPLLSAAIRWGWKETALTATSLIALFLIAGVLVAGRGSFELERFVIRSGHLIILSLLLIWFGIHQRLSRIFLTLADYDSGLDQEENPLHRALGFVVQACNAGGGALMMAPTGEEACEGFSTGPTGLRAFSLERPIAHDEAYSVFLYDLARDRAVTRLLEARFHFVPASRMLAVEEALGLGAREGLVTEVRTGTHQGWLVLWAIPDLSTDFIDLGRELGRVAGAILDRHALLEAIETGAAARARLSLARDVHDNIVQFLAGATFRVEAINRAATAGAKVGPELDELKRLLVEEQGEIRGFLLALRRDRELELADAVAELRALAERLSQQWSVDCRISTEGEKASIPIRLQLDLQQMLREAVANAVRHGGANRVDVGLAVERDRLQLRFADNGSGFRETTGKDLAEPWSLKERVERAHGSIRLVSEPGSTNIIISLPLAGAAA